MCILYSQLAFTVSKGFKQEQNNNSEYNSDLTLRPTRERPYIGETMHSALNL